MLKAGARLVGRYDRVMRLLPGLFLGWPLLLFVCSSLRDELPLLGRLRIVVIESAGLVLGASVGTLVALSRREGLASRFVCSGRSWEEPCLRRRSSEELLHRGSLRIMVEMLVLLDVLKSTESLLAALLRDQGCRPGE